MGAAYFYHLTRRPIEATLPLLLEKSLQQGWRVILRGTDQGRMEWLDEKLWLGPEEGFLPHGLSGGAHDEAQPVLLTLDPSQTGDCVMCVDGADIPASEVQMISRACILFDGNDAAAVQVARGQWKALTDAGCAAQYWSEDSGRWEKKAESSVG